MPGPTFLSGESVSLCTVEEGDISFVHETVNSPDIRKTMQPSRPYSLNEIRSLFTADPESSSAVRFVVAVDTEAVGLVGYSIEDTSAGIAEPSCWIHPSNWGEGYGSEAIELLVEYGFKQRRLHKFVAEVVEFNDASKRLVEKVGFVEEGRLREQDFVDGQYHDCVLYGLLATEWQSCRE
ncbi:GNAT family N-acetyltransferase [Halobaculum rubrum]|uniref:GNAT family N-acetyltransferase n=1 Tax=Halobaculum rubrum TaxID=2872158 RepID=UPI001CA3EE43|nr:GNAT family protein [Halobaculum rubrum]QZX99927.1 GNAT family N-acetyltransferase [Halobaculum rubrum]